MKAINLLGALISSAYARDPIYSILSVDGGGIRGIIPSKVLMHMESFAFENATAKGYDFPKYTFDNGTQRQGIPMKDLFDMMAGTSTGSILSTALSLPKENGGTDPEFWAYDVMHIYMN